MGQEALEKLGYEKIIRVAVKARWIEHRLPRSGNSFDQTLGFWAVFTEYAVAAGVMSQADSPAPGPADVVAIGILVLGLVDAGLLGGQILTSITTTAPLTGPTAAPPVPVPVAAPTSTPAPPVIPTATPTVIPTALPTALPTAVPTVIAVPKKHEAYCVKMRQECLQNKKQPEWNRKKFGDYKDCGACWRHCMGPERQWPEAKCPSTDKKN